jgi:tRNA dimethylallyltransferase
VLFLLGPTAAGKTALACALCDAFPLDIISVDSALVYRDMNIGTAKPDAAMQARYPHQLIDLISPEEAYSAADFRRDALAAIRASHARERVPFLVGGTMMYIKALLEGLSTLPVANPSIRAVIEAKAAESGWPALHFKLAAIDPVTAARLAPNDAQRIQRALEVYEITGTPLSALQQRAASSIATDSNIFPFAATIMALLPSAATPRAVLHERIAARFDAMLDEGLIAEVASLQTRYRLMADMPSMRCVGYRQVWQHLAGELTVGKMREQGVAATRQLAKRQMTWLRAMQNERAMTVFEQLDDSVYAQARQAVNEVL